MGLSELEAKRIAQRAEEEGDLRTAMSGCRELACLVALLARLRGELNKSPVVNIVVSPEWRWLRGLLLTALNDFPEAKLTVSQAIAHAPGWDVPGEANAATKRRTS
jgi:hypothetical protein